MKDNLSDLNLFKNMYTKCYTINLLQSKLFEFIYCRAKYNEKLNPLIKTKSTWQPHFDNTFQ